MKVSKPLSSSDHPLSKPSPINVSSSSSTHSNSNHCERERSSTDTDEDQSPPMSPLRLQQLSSSSSSIYSWSSSQGSGKMSDDDDSQPLCNSKEDRSSYNTKFAKYHLETYRKNDRIRWNFDFDHNRPLDDSHHHQHQTVARYQWKPAL